MLTQTEKNREQLEKAFLKKMFGRMVQGGQRLTSVRTQVISSEIIDATNGRTTDTSLDFMRSGNTVKQS